MPCKLSGVKVWLALILLFSLSPYSLLPTQQQPERSCVFKKDRHYPSLFKRTMMSFPRKEKQSFDSGHTDATLHSLKTLPCTSLPPLCTRSPSSLHSSHIEPLGESESTMYTQGICTGCSLLLECSSSKAIWLTSLLPSSLYQMSPSQKGLPQLHHLNYSNPASPPHCQDSTLFSLLYIFANFQQILSFACLFVYELIVYDLSPSL